MFEKTEGQLEMEYSRISWKGSRGNEPEEEIVGNFTVPANLSSGELSIGDINPLDMESLITQSVCVSSNGFCHINRLQQC